MGRRCGDTESAWAGLGEDDPRDLAELAADFIHERAACLAVRFAPLIALAQQGFDAGRGGRDELLRPPVEPMLFRLAGLGPSCSDVLVEIVERAGGETAVDQPQRM